MRNSRRFVFDFSGRNLAGSATACALSFLFLCTSPGQGISHAKFIAQNAAIKALEGEKPFVLRESWWKGNIAPGKYKLIQQQLFKKNTYHYWFAVADPDTAVLLNIYDGQGRIMETKTVRFEEGKNIVGLIVSPENTGIYYLRLALAKDAKLAQDYALIYAYR